MNLQVTAVKDSRARKEFIRLPWRIYSDNSNWVPPIISEEEKLFNPATHPFYKHAEVELFLAHDDNNQVVGRIAAIVNHNHIKCHQEKAGFFGFFECINSPEVARVLLDAVREYLKSKGMELMRGPANFSVNENWGALIEGFDSPPVFMMPYNPSYYPELFTSYGLRKAKDLYAYYIDSSLKVPEKFLRIAERIRSREGVVVRTINMKRFQSEIEIVKQVYNQAWQDNWGAVPMTDEEMVHLARELKALIVPDLVLIAEVNGEPAGFSLALPDYNQAIKKINGRLWPLGLFKLLWYRRQIRMIRVITTGVIKKYQKRGIDVLFYLDTIKNGPARGFHEAEMSWVLEDNVLMTRALESLGGRLYKKYRIYEMPA